MRRGSPREADTPAIIRRTLFLIFLGQARPWGRSWLPLRSLLGRGASPQESHGAMESCGPFRAPRIVNGASSVPLEWGASVQHFQERCFEDVQRHTHRHDFLIRSSGLSRERQGAAGLNGPQTTCLTTHHVAAPCSLVRTGIGSCGQLRVTDRHSICSSYFAARTGMASMYARKGTLGGEGTTLVGVLKHGEEGRMFGSNVPKHRPYTVVHSSIHCNIPFCRCVSFSKARVISTFDRVPWQPQLAGGRDGKDQ